MSAHPASVPSFQPRTRLNYAEVREKLRSESVSAVQSAIEITRVLADVERDLEDCDTEIYRLQTRIIYLKNQKERMKEYKICLRSLTCPIRKLPNEVLSYIFDYTCDMNEVLSRDVKRMPALLLTAVCARWRTLSSSSPILWSRMQIELQPTIPRWMNFPILTLFVRRSGQSPLDIEFTGTIPAGLKDHHRSAMSPLLQLSCRWRRLRIVCARSWPAIENHLTQLPLIEIIDASELFLDSRALDRFRRAPKLRKLLVAGAPIMLLNEQRFPWQQLTFLHLGDRLALGDGDPSEILKTCSNLTELCLRESRIHPLRPCVPARRTHALEKLSLVVRNTSFDVNLAETILSSITSPALTFLHIHAYTSHGDHEYTRPWPKESLHAFLSRSSCHLTTLSIKSIPVSDTELCELLYLLPSLLNLTLDDTNLSPEKSPLTSEFLQNLHACRGTSISSALVPNLTTLSLTFNGRDSSSDDSGDFNDEDFVDMVSSRWLPDPQYASQVEVACLRSVVVHFPNRDADNEIYRPLMYLEKAGMRVVVIWQHRRTKLEEVSE